MAADQIVFFGDKEYELPIEKALELARGHHMAGNLILAERTYRDILKTAPDMPNVLHLLGVLLYQTGNISGGIEYMQKSVELAPDEKEYWNNLGGVLVYAERNSEALECFDKALALAPAHVNALKNKAHLFWKMKKFVESEETARLAAAQCPGDIDLAITLGLAMVGQEKYEDAIKLWEDTVEYAPQDSRLWSNIANACRETQQHDKGLNAARKAVEHDPKNIEAQNNLGCILRDLGDAENAVDAFRAAVDERPQYDTAQHNMALALLDLRRFKEARVAAKYAIAFAEAYKHEHSNYYTALSVAQRELGEFYEAQLAAQRAIQIDPDNAAAYADLADVLYLYNRFEDGYAALQVALDKNEDDPFAYEKLASIFERLDEPDRALEAIDKAIALAPHIRFFKARKAAILFADNRLEAALELATEVNNEAPGMMLPYTTISESLVSLDRTEEAETWIRKGLENLKAYPTAYHTLTNFKKFKSTDDPDLQDMLSLMDTAKKMGAYMETSLNFSLGAAYDSLKDYDRAFEHYKLGNDLKASISPFDLKLEPNTFQIVKDQYPPEFIETLGKQGSSSDVPVFIVGMPRSGTTLTEQILAAHPDVYGAGELADLLRTKRRFLEISPENAAQAGDLYVQFIRERDPSGKAKRITDKMPGNFRHLGLVAALLPNAKIIHCRRDPIDTGLSNYKQLFSNGQFWSFTLEGIAFEHKRYLDLMEYWRKILPPGQMLEIDYEDTVSDTEGQVRRLLDFIGLEWHDACLEPHKHKRSVMTASKAQVTQPIYKTSVKGWKRYEKHLQPLVRELCPEEALPEE